MVVYSAFFKVIRRNLFQIMIYIAIFITLAITLTDTNSTSIVTDFTESKIKMTYINEEGDTWLTRGLEAYLSDNAILIPIPNESKQLQDALFFKEVEYILKVPEGFSEDLLKGQVPQLEKMADPQSTGSIYMDNLVNKYLNTVKSYIQHSEIIDEEQLIASVERDLAVETDVKMSHPVEDMKNDLRRASYFNYMSYSLISVLILGVCSVMIVFNQKDLKKRNMCAPLKLKNRNLQMILGHLSFAGLIWCIMLLPSVIMYGSYMLTGKGLLLILNSFVFTFSALSMSYLISNMITNRNAMSAAANVIGLGTCFISGVFVPQELLGATVLKIASFTPTYWYVKTNNTIVDLLNFNKEQLAPIFINLLIIIGFGIAMLAINLAIIKQKRAS